MHAFWLSLAQISKTKVINKWIVLKFLHYFTVLVHIQNRHKQNRHQCCNYYQNSHHIKICNNSEAKNFKRILIFVFILNSNFLFLVLEKHFYTVFERRSAKILIFLFFENFFQIFILRLQVLYKALGNFDLIFNLFMVVMLPLKINFHWF